MTKITEKYCTDTINLKKVIEFSALELAQRLSRIKNEELWQGQWDSFSDFLAEIDFTESKASKYMRVVDVWVNREGYQPKELNTVGIDKLYTAIPLLEHATSDRVLEKVTLLRRSDIQEEIKEAQGHEHRFGPERYARCDCGKFTLA